MYYETNSDVAQKLVALCLRYANALERDSDYSEMKRNKLRKITALSHLVSPDLTQFRTELGKPEYQRVLSEHRTPELLRMVQYILIGLTFPLTVPLLMLHSWYLRGTVDFSKSHGEALLEQMVALSDAEIARQRLIRQACSPAQGLQSVPERIPSACRALVEKRSFSSDWVPSGIAGTPFSFANTPLSLFSSKELTGDGEAIVIASRIRPFNYQLKEPLVIDIYSKFRYSNQPPMTTTITIQTDFVRAQDEVQERPSFYEPLDSFLGHPGFWDAYRKARHKFAFYEHGLYEKALALAETPYQKILALEGIINKQHWLYKAYESDFRRAQYDYCSEGREYSKAKMAKLIEHINGYLNQLPPEYERITPDVAHLQEHFARVFQLLSEKKVGQAAYLYRRTPEISAFISYAFPHLVAVSQQLDAVFRLIVVHGFMILPHRVEPKDEALRRQKILAYVKKGKMWCAFKTREGDIKRLCIEPDLLGGAEEVMRQGITREQEQRLFDALAAKGYYELNIVSPAAALEQLKAAYQTMNSYDALGARCLLAEGIAPLQLLMRAGRHAIQQTPAAVKMALRRQERDEWIGEMRSGEFQPPENDELDDAIWDELLYETAGCLRSFGVEISGDSNFSHSPC